MGKFSKAGGREMPELNTSSLPDLVFAFLFFIMMVTSMREVTLMYNSELHRLLNFRSWKRNRWLRSSM